MNKTEGTVRPDLASKSPDREASRAAIAARRSARMLGTADETSLPHSLMVRLAAESSRLRKLPPDAAGDVYGTMAAETLAAIAQGSDAADAVSRPTLRRLASAVSARMARTLAREIASDTLTATGTEDQETRDRTSAQHDRIVSRGYGERWQGTLSRADVYAVSDWARESMRPADVVAETYRTRSAMAAAADRLPSGATVAELAAWKLLPDGAETLFQPAADGGGYVPERLATYRTEVARPGDLLTSRGMRYASAVPGITNGQTVNLRRACQRWARMVATAPSLAETVTAETMRYAAQCADLRRAEVAETAETYRPSFPVGWQGAGCVRTAHLDDETTGKAGRRWASVEGTDAAGRYCWSVSLSHTLTGSSADIGPVGNGTGWARLWDPWADGGQGGRVLAPFGLAAEISARRSADAIARQDRLTDGRRTVSGLMAMVRH